MLRGPGGSTGVGRLFSTHFFTFVTTIPSGSLFTCRSLKVKRTLSRRTARGPQRSDLRKRWKKGFLPFLPEAQEVLWVLRSVRQRDRERDQRMAS